jgi:xanthine dehydrogenase accessory factor
MPAGPVDWDWFAALAGALRSGGPVALATVIDGPHTGAKRLVRPDGDHLGSLGDPDLDGAVTRDALGALSAGSTEVRHYGPGGQIGRDDVTVFIESHAPPPRMLIFGAVDFTAALARVGAILGFRVTVCDARQTFATDARFPMADEVVVDWPHRLLEQTGTTLGPDDAVCVLTHDSKFDVPAIIAALATDVGYIGVLGSRHTHEDRLQRLEAEGVDDVGLTRIMAPIGLDIGGSTPEETAVSIGAEIIACRSGRQVPSLRDGSGPIHSSSPSG